MKSLKHFQKKLRHQQTDAESLLWYHLRNRQLADIKFRRQHQIKNYIVDFICLEANLIIELDGGQHNSQRDYDNRRTKDLKVEGFHVIRFWNDDVLKHINEVLLIIFQEVMKNKK